jgi:hypothetical protein
MVLQWLVSSMAETVAAVTSNNNNNRDSSVQLRFGALILLFHSVLIAWLCVMRTMIRIIYFSTHSSSSEQRCPAQHTSVANK